MFGRIAFCITMIFLTGVDARAKRWAVKTTWAFIVLQVAVNITTLVAFYCQCGGQLDIMWNPAKAALHQSYCLNPKIQTDLGYFQGTFNTLTDAYLTALPAILIEHSGLSLRKKIGLAFLLCLSVLALIASAVKTYEAKALSENTDFTCMLAHVFLLAEQN